MVSLYMELPRWRHEELFWSLYFFLRIAACLCVLLSHLMIIVVYQSMDNIGHFAIHSCPSQAIPLGLYELLGYCHALPSCYIEVA